ncbi:MAG: hypothetical protein K2J77_13105 [Oscillospiraceae bacterium]|nr:hypothetical protein [Oscillospiraceae bacterium]
MARKAKNTEQKETQVFDNIFDEAFAKLGEPKNDLERDTLNYIRPLVSEMIAQDIVGKGLTLSGCIDHCFGKGHKFEVKKGNRGLARVTEEQHFEWVREYFGIEGAAEAVPPKEPLKLSGENTPRLDLDLDSLFD